MKKSLAIPVTLLVLLTLLAGCGSSYDNARSVSYSAAVYDGEEYYPAAEEAVYEGYWADEPAAGTAVQSDIPSDLGDVKMIYTANVTMESTEFDEAVAAIARLTEQCGGYYEASSLSDSGSARRATFTVRVPAAKYRAFLDGAGELCHVTYQEEYAEDVSESYYDTAGRLETQKTKLARLQELLAEAQHMDDIIVLENEISETEELIDRLSGSLRHYDALVAYSTVTISLKEVKVLTEVVEVTETFGSRLGSAFRSGLQGFGEMLADIAVALAYSWLWLVLIAAVVIAILFATKKKRAELRERRKSAPPVSVPSYSKPSDDKDE